jgi:hypothetical protein
MGWFPVVPRIVLVTKSARLLTSIAIEVALCKAWVARTDGLEKPRIVLLHDEATSF